MTAYAHKLRSWLVEPWNALFLVAVYAFLALRIGAVDQPYYWDEAWVYAPAVQAMLANGPSLAPDAIAPELSRGHPMLFHATAALWATLFGDSRTALHLFALIVSLAVVSVLKNTGDRIAGPATGTIAAFLLLLNEAFVAQALFLLPEMFLALWVLLGVRAFLLKAPWSFVLYTTAALFTKESAVVLVLSVLVVCLFGLHSFTPKERLRWAGLALVPVLAALAFFQWQYTVMGWYLFPDHMGMITWGAIDVEYKARLGYATIMENQGLVVGSYSIGLVAPWLLFRARWPMALLLTVANVAFVKILFGRWPLPPTLTLVVCSVLAGASILLLHYRLKERDPQVAAFVSTALVFCAGFVAFSALNFFSDRYLLCCAPLLALVLPLVWRTAAPEFSNKSIVIPGAVCALALLWYFGTDTKVGDTRMNHQLDIAKQQAVIEALSKRIAPGDAVAASFMTGCYLSDPGAGYLPPGQPAINALALNDTAATWLIYSQHDALAGDTVDHTRYAQVRADRGYPAWASLYQRR